MSKKVNSTKSTWIDPDDVPPAGRDWFESADHYRGDQLLRRGRPKSENPKKAVSLRRRRNSEVVDWFKQRGPGWQTRINDELRKIAGLG